MFSRLSLTLLAIAVLYSHASAQSNYVEYDKDAKVTFKPKDKPKFANKPKTSGYCCVVFDINTQGIPQNIETTYCTHASLADPIKKRMSKYRYSPAIIDSEPVIRKDKTLRQGYVRRKGKLKKIISGPNGYLTRKHPSTKIPPPPKKIIGSKWLKNHYHLGKPCIEYIS